MGKWRKKVSMLCFARTVGLAFLSFLAHQGEGKVAHLASQTVFIDIWEYLALHCYLTLFPAVLSPLSDCNGKPHESIPFSLDSTQQSKPAQVWSSSLFVNTKETNMPSDALAMTYTHS